jgi:hypothetical protein
LGVVVALRHEGFLTETFEQAMASVLANIGFEFEECF